MKENFSDRIDRAREALREAEHVLLGGEAGSPRPPASPIRANDLPIILLILSQNTA